MSSRRFVELVVLARRLVTPALRDSVSRPTHTTGRRQIGGELTQFSFRLAFVIDLVYVGVGAVGGAALTRTALDGSVAAYVATPPCSSPNATIGEDSAIARPSTHAGQPGYQGVPR